MRRLFAAVIVAAIVATGYAAAAGTLTLLGAGSVASGVVVVNTRVTSTGDTRVTSTGDTRVISP